MMVEKQELWPKDASTKLGLKGLSKPLLVMMDWKSLLPNSYAAFERWKVLTTFFKEVNSR